MPRFFELLQIINEQDPLGGLGAGGGAPGGIPGGLGGPPLAGGPGGLGGGMGGLGGGMGGMGAPPPIPGMGGMGGQQQQQQSPPMQVKTKDVWSILEKLLSGHSSADTTNVEKEPQGSPPPREKSKFGLRS